jgi:hypothetical protein
MSDLTLIYIVKTVSTFRSHINTLNHIVNFPFGGTNFYYDYLFRIIFKYKLIMPFFLITIFAIILKTTFELEKKKSSTPYEWKGHSSRNEKTGKWCYFKSEENNEFCGENSFIDRYKQRLCLNIEDNNNSVSTLNYINT